MMSLSPAVVISSDNNDNDNDGDYNSNDENNNNNSNGLDESFSSLLSSSINNISKSFDQVLEIGTIHCLPIITMTTTRITTTDDNDINDPQGEENNGRVKEEEEDIRPYIPFRLPLACEYCGSSSVRDCHVFDPKCRRPETFFPKVKPPFVVAMCGGYGDRGNNNNKNSRTYETKCWSTVVE